MLEVRSTVKAAVVGLGLAVAVSSCGDEGTSAAGTTVPETLLSAKTVRGKAIGHSESHLMNASSCGLDGGTFFTGSSNENTIAYTRSRDGHRELVLVGSWSKPSTSFADGLASLRKGLRSRACNTPPVVSRLLPTADPSAIAFSAVSKTEDHERVSTVRSYTLVQPSENAEGELVMVSIKRTGDGDPSPADLGKLTQAQVKRTEARLSGAAAG